MKKTMMMMMMITMMMMSNNTTTQHDTHMRAMIVTQLDYTQDIVTCVDAVGFEWQFYGCEDYAINDLVCTLMDDNGTPDTILDDIIIDAEYTGYWME